MTLNAIISAWLLQESSQTILMSKLLGKATLIYDYLKWKSNKKTYMTVKPMKGLVTKHVHGLGFKTEKINRKESKIQLQPKDKDWRCKLMLAYYSTCMIPAFLIEGCLSTLIKSAVSLGTYQVGQSVEIAPLFDIITIYADLFRGESLAKLEPTHNVVM